MRASVDLESLGLDNGGHLLVERALDGLAPDDVLQVKGRRRELQVHLSAWCRARGHAVLPSSSAGDDSVDGADGFSIAKGTAEQDRWAGAVRAGRPDRPSAHADPTWGLAARGALVESGGPPLDVAWVDRDLVWTDIAAKLFARANASPFDPETVVDWTQPADLKPEIEDAVVQIMTFLVENEHAALIIPARLLGSLHPHFREVMQLLASQVADEARHVELFTKRGLMHREELGLSTVEGRSSLQTLLDEPDFTLSAFLLSVLGEGTFVDLLQFLNHHAPDPATATVTRLAGRDEARHVAFGVSHTAHVATSDPGFLRRLRESVERRHDALKDTAGLNQKVYDSLVVLAAGEWSPAGIQRGWGAVQDLQRKMDEGRRQRLAYIGFPDDEAAELSALHTRNFM